jgi:hypothetical protein
VFPPAADRLDGELAGVVVGSHRHPTGVRGHVVHAGRGDLAQFSCEVIHVGLQRFSDRPVLLTGVAEIADQLLPFPIDADHQLSRGDVLRGWALM